MGARGIPSTASIIDYQLMTRDPSSTHHIQVFSSLLGSQSLQALTCFCCFSLYFLQFPTLCLVWTSLVFNVWGETETSAACRVTGRLVWNNKMVALKEPPAGSHLILNHFLNIYYLWAQSCRIQRALWEVLRAALYSNFLDPANLWTVVHVPRHW